MRAASPDRFQFLEHGLQLLLEVRRQMEQPQQFRHVRRDVIFLRQQPDDLIFHFILICPRRGELYAPSLCLKTLSKPAGSKAWNLAAALGNRRTLTLAVKSDKLVSHF